MFDSKKVENEIENIFALIGSIKENAGKIQGAENADCPINGISEMCEIAGAKLLIVRKEISEVKNV